MSVDRENPLLFGAVVYRLCGGNGRITIGEYGEFTRALESYGFEASEVYHISCDIEDYYDDRPKDL